jgi:hypothetical protein
MNLYNLFEGAQDFLWHGSTQMIPVLTPRQANDTGGAAGSNQNAIYATADKNVALAMGLTERGSDTGMFPNDPQMVLFSGKIRHGQKIYLHKLPMKDANGQDLFVQGGNSREFHSKPGITQIKPMEILEVPVDSCLNLIRNATPQDLKLRQKYMKTNETAGVGVIANKSQARDPRYSMSLTKDVRPGQIQKNLKAFNLAEDNQPDLKQVGNQFVKHCVKDLGIQQLPKIKLVQEIVQSEHPTFGLFDPNTNTIQVAVRDRHVMDILRTLAHELTHHKQREENRIQPGDGETGSDIENEANAKAGVLMRDFADQNPDLF